MRFKTAWTLLSFTLVMRLGATTAWTVELQGGFSLAQALSYPSGYMAIRR